MRLVSLLVLTAAAALSQPVVESVAVNPSYGTAIVQLKISGSVTGQPSFYISYGTDTNPTFRNATRTTWPVSLPSPVVLQAMPIGALQAGTTYYFKPVVVGSGNVTSSWDCNTATGGVTTTVPDALVGCDTASGLGWFRTMPLPANAGTAAEVLAPDISPLPVAPPVPTLPPLAVQPGSTSDLTAKLASCAANTNGNSQVQEVLLPAGATWKVEMNLPVKSGSGMCIVRTDDMSHLPPDGVRVGKTDAPAMATIVLPLTSAGQNDFSAAFNANSNTQGWYFLGLRFTTETGRTSSQQVYTITDVNDTGDTVTVSPPHNYAFHAWVTHQIWGVEGSWTDPKGPNGTFQNGGFAGPDKIRLMRPYPLACGSGPCYQTGGKIRISVESGVCGASNENPIVITTCEEHGMVNNAAVPIDSISAKALTVAAWHGMPNIASEFVGLIEGSSIPEWNGQWVLGTIRGTSITIPGGPGIDCTSNCGTIRRLDPLHIKGVEGNTAANGSSYFRVLTPTTLELLGKAGNGDYRAGGIMAQEPAHWLSLVSIGNQARRVHFDRCLFQPGGWPVRMSFALVHSASESSIINNYFDDIQFFRQVRPQTNRRAALDTYSVNQYYISTTVAIDTTSGDTKLIENNYIDAHGISVYSQESPSAPPFQNGIIRRNVFYVSDSKRAGSPTSDGLYYPHRHHLEWKRGNRFTIDGNRFIGGWIDFNVCGPIIMATPRGGDTIRDLTFTNNTLQGGTTGLYLLGMDDRASSTTPLVRRIAIENNVFTDLDGYRVSTPHDDAVSPAMCGFSLYVNFGVESLTVRHNLFRWSRGARTQTFAFQQGRGSGLTIMDNILWYTNDENEGPLWKAGFNAASNAGSPAPAGNVRQVFDALWSHSQFTNNIVIPGVRSSLDTGKYDSTSGSDTLFRSDCVNYFTGFTGVFCIGNPSGNDSANQRTSMMRFMDPGAQNFRLAADAPALTGALPDIDGSSRVSSLLSSDGRGIGPDYDKLEVAQGSVLNVHEADVGNDAASLVYIAPDTAVCAVDYSLLPFSAPGSPVTRVFDSGGSRERSVRLTGLTTSSTYYYRVLCAAEQPAGTFQTR